MRERYVRPPLLGREAPPRTYAVWRFRLVALLLVALAALAGVLLVRAFSGGERNPGVGGTLGQVSRSSTLAPL